MLLLPRPGPVRAADPPLAPPLPEAAHRRDGRERGGCAVAPGVWHCPGVHLLGELLAGGGHFQGGEGVGPGGETRERCRTVLSGLIGCQMGWEWG